MCTQDDLLQTIRQLEKRIGTRLRRATLSLRQSGGTTPTDARKNMASIGAARTRPRHARHFGERSHGVRVHAQAERVHDGVEGAVREGELLRVALHKVHVARHRAHHCRLGLGLLKHALREIEARELGDGAEVVEGQVDACTCVRQACFCMLRMRRCCPELQRENGDRRRRFDGSGTVQGVPVMKGLPCACKKCCRR